MTPAAAVGVVGASARAAVGSLRRAGFAAWAVDLFADRDLKRMAPVVRCPADRYPHGLPELCDQFPPGPVMYTGGLENYPDVVRELAARRPLWGNGPEVLERVRDPFRLHDVLSDAGFAVPRLLPPGEPAPRTGRWLCKPLRSAGGHGIRFAAPGDRPPSGTYFQEFIEGTPVSGLFYTASGQAMVIGGSVQLVGVPWHHAKPFAYCGSVFVRFPDLGDGIGRSLSLLRPPQVLATAGLTGVWGIDYVYQDGGLYVAEVNPRYTASFEVIELCCGEPLIWGPPNTAWDAACLTKVVGHRFAVLGKAVYFAPHRITFPPAGPWDVDLAGEFDPWRVPDFADIPEPGEVIEPGWPVLTVFATGSTPDEVRGRLQSRAAELDALFSRGQSP